MPHDEEIDVVTYNVHRCVGSDGAASVERVAGVIVELAADVVALQEVISSERAPRLQLERIAEATRMVPVAGATLLEDDGHYGNGLLLRAPPDRVVRHDLSVAGAEPRGALEVTIETAVGPARVAVTHLGLAARERRRQLARLAEIVRAPGAPWLALLGDFNEWRPRPFGASLASLGPDVVAVPAARTFPSRRPLVALDRILRGASTTLVASGAHGGPAARAASDHLPAYAELRLASS